MSRAKLQSMDLLAGHVEIITVMQLRNGPGDILAQVALGKKYIVTRYGESVAEIQRPEPSALELGAAVRRLGLAGATKENPR
ncbi:hypothetical protein LCGC14_0886640 [marine sediment metagenome]|uniref:Prevent-host-death family protein n=1 Tax=marine sediment metagenome TaxID=412755 RepID=A0A0F9PL43_9ZZZZ